MDKDRKHRIASIIGGAIFVFGLVLCAHRSSQIITHKITTAKVLSVEEFKAECRRVSGKYGECFQAKVGIEFPISKEAKLNQGNIIVERNAEALKVGSSIKVMFLEGKPETVRLADFSSGWKGPLGVFFIGSLILIVSRAKKTA